MSDYDRNKYYGKKKFQANRVVFRYNKSKCSTYIANNIFREIVLVHSTVGSLIARIYINLMLRKTIKKPNREI